MEIKENEIPENAYDVLTANCMTAYGIRNVKNYEYKNRNSWWIETASSENYVDTVYLIIETTDNSAFGHWVYETAIYIPLYNILKMKYHTVKIILDPANLKTFKYHILQYFDISRNDIVTSITHANNICYFPKPNSSLINKSITEEYKQTVHLFRTFFHTRPVEKTIDIVLLPRQKKENHDTNRIIDTHELEQAISSMKNTYILHTDNITDIKTQIDIIQKSKIIIVTDGSSFHVNGLFANNSKIIVLGNQTDHQASIYQKANFLNEIVSLHNSVIKLPGSSFVFEHIQPYLQ